MQFSLKAVSVMLMTKPTFTEAISRAVTAQNLHAHLVKLREDNLADFVTYFSHRDIDKMARLARRLTFYCRAHYPEAYERWMKERKARTATTGA